MTAMGRGRRAVWAGVDGLRDDAAAKPRLLKRQDDGAISTVYTSVVGTGMSDGNWYNCKLVIHGDPGNSALQRLRLYVDVNGNSAFDESTEKFLDTTLIDDDW